MAKNVYSLVGYQFKDGPYHDLLVQYGYDPRVKPESRMQALFLSSSIGMIFIPLYQLSAHLLPKRGSFAAQEQTF